MQTETVTFTVDIDATPHRANQWRAVIAFDSMIRQTASELLLAATQLATLHKHYKNWPKIARILTSRLYAACKMKWTNPSEACVRQDRPGSKPASRFFRQESACHGNGRERGWSILARRK